MKKFKLNRQSGSVFTVLLAGVAMAGALSVVVYQIMSGPMASMVRVGNKTMTKTQLHSVSNIMIMDALNQPASGDCDADGSVEPREWRETTNDKPINGGLIPNTVGAPLNDPWNSEYGYCVWDTGALNNPAAGVGTCNVDAKRLKGSPNTSAGNADTQYVVAIVSAGPNRRFETTCNAYVDEATGLLTEAGDDVIQKFTYAEASSATSALWKVKENDPDVTISKKDVEVGTGDVATTTTIEGSSGLIRATALTTLGLIEAGGAIRLATQNDVTSCALGNAGDMRYNSSTGSIEVCDGSVWKESSGSGASGFNFTAVPFADASGDLIDDITNLAWDATNNALKVGEKVKFVSVTGDAPIGIVPAALSFSSLSDALITTPALDQMLIFDGTDWVNRDPVTGATEINELSDGKTNSSSVFLGSSAGAVNTGSSNVGVGQNALYSNTSGGGNIAVGRNALYLNTIGSANTVNGNGAMNSNEEGSSNSAFGYMALNRNTSGDDNVAVGQEALSNNTTGDNNVAIGSLSLRGSLTLANNSGDYNIAIGNNSLMSNSTGTSNVAIGPMALYYNINGRNNTAIGRNALNSNRAKGENTAIGYHSMMSANSATSATTTDNTAVGAYSLHGSGTTANNTGTGNTVIGHSALMNNSSGALNVAVGTDALIDNTIGTGNTATGYKALRTNVAKRYSTAIGYWSMYNADDTTSNDISFNTAVGAFSLQGLSVVANNTGIHNTAIGHGALINNTSGTHNTAVGSVSLSGMSVRSENTAIGAYSMQRIYGAIAESTYNTAVGAYSLQGSAAYSSNTGMYNTAIGHSAMIGNSTGGWNTAVGGSALSSNTDGNYNTASGSSALAANTSGGWNTATGHSALLGNTTGDYNTANGLEALRSNTTGNYNTASGVAALRSNLDGYYNVALGHAALYTNVAKAENTAIGFYSMRYANSSTSGGESFNTAVGAYSLQGSTSASANTGTGNTAVGHNALMANTSGTWNTAIGQSSMGANSTGGQNTALGTNSLPKNTSGASNVSIGLQSLWDNTTGVGNVALGHSSLFYNTNGNYNTAVGHTAGPTVTGLSNTTAIGNGAIPTVSNTMKFGNDGVTNNYFRGNVVLSGGTGNTAGNTFGLYKGTGSLPGYASDSYPTLKTSFNAIYFSAGAAFSAMMGTNGVWSPQSDRRLKKDIKTSDLGLGFINKLKPVSFKWKKTNDLDYGFIAQDIDEALDGLKVNFLTVGNEGETMDKAEDQWMLAKTGLISPMVKSIQQLDDKVEALSTELSSLRNDNTQQNRLPAQAGIHLSNNKWTPASAGERNGGGDDNASSLGMTRERVLEYLLTALAALFALFMISTEIRIRRLKSQGKSNL